MKVRDHATHCTALTAKFHMAKVAYKRLQYSDWSHIAFSRRSVSLGNSARNGEQRGTSRSTLARSPSLAFHAPLRLKAQGLATSMWDLSERSTSVRDITK